MNRIGYPLGRPLVTTPTIVFGITFDLCAKINIVGDIVDFVRYFQKKLLQVGRAMMV